MKKKLAWMKSGIAKVSNDLRNKKMLLENKSKKEK